MNLRSRQKLLIFCTLVITLLGTSFVQADVKLPAIFGSHMVLQQKQKNPIWGRAETGEKVTVTVSKQSHSTVADKTGYWRVKLDALPVGGPYTITVAGKNKVVFEDVLVGEVWVCSGQSNMSFSVNRANDPVLESMTAKYPNIRFISVPNVGTQEPQETFKGKWVRCNPSTVKGFSAVGYFFGRQLHQTLDVPVGLINDAWGGSSCEAWINRELLEKDEQFKPLMDRWVGIEKTFDYDKALAVYQNRLTVWKEKVKAAKAAGKPLPRQPRKPHNRLTDQHRPGNLYNGKLKPIIGYGIKGAIWYQGESNASRAYQYRELFPLMIQNWRDEWKQGDFPFYWVQLADHTSELPKPGNSTWAELREAQTMTMKRLPNTGEAVIIDLGEGDDIHPTNKQDVAKRLARWALAKDYGIKVAYHSPQYKSMKVHGDKIVLTFDYVGSGLDLFDVRKPIGFAIAGDNKKFVWAEAKIISKNQVIAWSSSVKKPVSVRYAWANNPVCNLRNKEGLWATPFRTDSWKGVTADKK
ncbi:Sialic acid-specific 9-O-acetylesterase [hydrothermal vent metagenome]|uniref:Sialic acid-specific 9-O-acetylesterase n=1 Tax=hydrothermal vent metagenome TaxID=652676 RepID=A0A3B1E813_9ZZZZ